MGTAPPRILLCGDVLGRLNQLFKRVQSVGRSAGPFDALLCVGQFFPDSPDDLLELSQYLDGRSLPPIPTYFTGDYGSGAAQTLSKALKSPANAGFKTDGIELCRNLYWLRGSGKFSLQGLSVAYLSGRHGSSGSPAIGVYSEDDVGALRALETEEDGLVDIFLTNEWPSGVWNGVDVSNGPEGISDISGCDDVVAELVAEIKPRYHVAGTRNLFFARDPYLNDKAVHVTRFIGLGSVGNKKKEKFIHAISPTPASSMAPSEISLKSPNTTISPYKLVTRVSNPLEAEKKPINSGDNPQYWRYDMSQKRQKRGDANSGRLCFKFTSTGSCDRGEKCHFRHEEEARNHYMRNICFDYLNKGKCERGPDCEFQHSLSEVEQGSSQRRKSVTSRVNMEKKCWFCLSNSEVESHLLISIGQSYYCALAKGPLVQDHTLLIPVEHKPNSLAVLPEGDIELGKFKNSLRMYFKKLRKEVIFYEWVLPDNSHANIQAIPIPLSRLSLVQRAFKLASERLGFQFATLTLTEDLNEVTRLLRVEFNSMSSFFYVELPDGSVLIHSDPDKEKFPVQFGREVLAGLLNMVDRADWRNCKVNKEEEIKMVESFKMGFDEFDPAR